MKVNKRAIEILEEQQKMDKAYIEELRNIVSRHLKKIEKLKKEREKNETINNTL